MNFFQKSVDEIKQGMLASIQSAQENGNLPKVLNFYRGPFRGLVELWSFGLYQIYGVLDRAIQQAVPMLADEAEWMQQHIEQVGLTRKSARRASGRLWLERSDSSGNWVVPSGRVFSTLPDGNGEEYRFLSIQDEIIPDGVLFAEISVTAEKEGTQYNVAPFTITEMKTHIPGIEKVENRYDWIDVEGTDTESIEDMRDRYVLAWKGLGGANKHAYKSWALSVAGVHTVEVIDNHPRGQGTIDVLILGSAGLPGTQLIEDVSSVIESNRPINDDVAVSGPTVKEVYISLTLVVIDDTIGSMVADVKNVLNQLFDPLEGLGIGVDVSRDRLIADCMGVDPKIKRIEWTLPTWDENGIISVADNEIAVLGEAPTVTWEKETT